MATNNDNDFNIRVSLPFSQMANEDLPAFDLLYRELKKPVFLLALSILKDYGLAEDVMQETFLKVREHATQFHGWTSPKAWIMTITRNISLNLLRQRGHETCDFETIESIITQTEQDQQSILDFYRALEPLDKQEQSIVIMKIVAGFRHNEIAEIIGLKTVDVRKRYSRALQKLKKYFNDSAIRKGD